MLYEVITGQAEAVRLALSRALCEVDADNRQTPFGRRVSYCGSMESSNCLRNNFV